MTRVIFIACSIFLFCHSAKAQDITLPTPNLKEHSLSVVQALQTRHSVRNFDSNKDLSLQQISNLCWAAVGISREDGRLTSPTAMNRQEIRLYVFMEKGVYEYQTKEHKLIEKSKGDYRRLLASAGGKAPNGNRNFKQDFVLDAPVSLLMVIDFEKFGRKDEKAVQMGCVDAGNVSENINIYCQAVGLATVPRATHDSEAIRTLLGLGTQCLPIMNNPIGYEKRQ